MVLTDFHIVFGDAKFWSNEMMMKIVVLVASNLVAFFEGDSSDVLTTVTILAVGCRVSIKNMTPE